MAFEKSLLNSKINSEPAFKEVRKNKSFLELINFFEISIIWEGAIASGEKT